MYILDNIIKKYSYPWCNSSTLLTIEEKQLILKDEFSFIKQKIQEYNNNIIVIQIPRIIYDMYNIYYNIKYNFDNMMIYSYSITNVSSYEDYVAYVDMITRDNYHLIIELNGIIIKDIIIKDIITFFNCLKIMNRLIDTTITLLKSQLMKLIYIDEFLIYKMKIDIEIFEKVEELSITPVIRFLTKMKNKDISDFKYIKFLYLALIKIIERKSNEIVLNLSEEEKTKIPLELLQNISLEQNNIIDIMLILDNRMIIDKIINDYSDLFLFIFADKFSNFSTILNQTYNMKNNKVLLQQILYDEMDIDTSHMILYRGVSENKDNTIDRRNENKSYSLSFNTSLFNGLISDYTACSYIYMAPSGDYKYKYIIKKFFYHDNSIESNIYFIPPIHPFMQLFCNGEFWHARSKVGKDSIIDDISAFAGIFHKSNEAKNNIMPDYIMSEYTVKELGSKYTDIKKTRNEIIDRKGQIYLEFFNKYMKYKTKYLNLHKLY